LPGLVDAHTHPGAEEPGRPPDHDVCARTCGGTWCRRHAPRSASRRRVRRPDEGLAALDKINFPDPTSAELSTYTRNMTVHPDVFDAALALPQAERAELAHQLLASLDEPADDPAVVAAEWTAEIERRVGGIAAGDTEGISCDEVRKQFKR
jgi:putative addiction module component (TIGR02574 family)